MSNDKRRRQRQNKRDRLAQEHKAEKKAVRKEAREAKRSPGLTIDAIGLRSLERDDKGNIFRADSATFTATTNGSLLVLDANDQKPFVIGWGFVDAIVEAVAQRRKRDRWWRRIWRAMRGPS